jgi:nicotinamidase-related amidase
MIKLTVADASLCVGGWHRDAGYSLNLTTLTDYWQLITIFKGTRQSQWDDNENKNWEVGSLAVPGPLLCQGPCCARALAVQSFILHPSSFILYFQEIHMKSALLIIDVQKEFFKFGPTTTQSLNDAIEYINAAIALFREKNLPIICVQHMEEAEKLVPGIEGFDLPDALNILPSDLHIHKTYGNSFNKTSLENELRELGVDTVIITGFCAEHCVLSTYRGAQDLDLTPIILRGSLASGTLENITFVEGISDIISYGALKKLLG